MICSHRCVCQTFPDPVVLASHHSELGKHEWFLQLTLWQLQHVCNNKGWYLINQESWARAICKTRQFYVLWKVWKRGEIYETRLTRLAAVEGTVSGVECHLSNCELNLFHREVLIPWVFRTATNLCGIASNTFELSFSDCWHILNSMWPEKKPMSTTTRWYPV